MEIQKGQKIFINSCWNFVGWRKGSRKFLGKKWNISLQRSQGRSEMPTDFLGNFKIWPFCLKIMGSLKKKIKIPLCKGKAAKGGVKCPEKGTKPANELKWTVMSWAKRAFSVLQFHFLLKSLGKNKKKINLLVFPIYLNFCHHFPAPVFWVLPPSLPPMLRPCELAERSQERCPKPLTASTWMVEVSSGTCPPMLLRPVSSHAYLSKMGKRLLLGPSTPRLKHRSKKMLVVF